VKRGTIKAAPVVITAAVIALATLCDIPSVFDHLGFIQKFEWMTYDWRLREAVKYGCTTDNTNLLALNIDDETIAKLAGGYFGEPLSFPFPRSVYGRAVRELKEEGATVVGFDILMDQPRASDPVVRETNGTSVEIIGSDAFFARQLKAAGNVVLARNRSLEGIVEPYPLFRTNATPGDISSSPDFDGVLRRVKPYDPEDGWALAVILAAKALNLNLEHPEFGPGEIILGGPNGLERRLPLDREGYMLINWHIPKRVIPSTSLLSAFGLDFLRHAPASDAQLAIDLKLSLQMLRTNGFPSPNGQTPFKDKIVFVGSTATGNNVSDKGATPLAKDDFLISKHWNIANSILENQYIRTTPYWLDALLIFVLGVFSGLITLRSRIVIAVTLVLAALAAFVAMAWLVFMRFNLWVPIVLPAAGSLFLTHIAMVAYLYTAEQSERRRVRAVFSKIVAPEVVNTLLESEKLSLGGARRQITVFFADIRGFTEMTDTIQARAEDHVRDAKLSPELAEAYFDQRAAETLETVNLYLAAIADMVKKHAGTLDKYIGDCVMAFWGAPVPNEKHALGCVRAAIDAQRALHALNQTRVLENKRREQENPARVAAGEAPLPVLPVLSLGSGINSGTAIVGLMGSDAHILNYTVFGREVNLASRLESLSGRGRIIVGEGTYLDLKRDDPALAATCVPQPPATVKGFRSAVNTYEVPWKESAPATAAPQTQTAVA
jgi:class 3 adenylate cyclase/CHASE2 domain-containing sensor protein